MKVSVVIPAHNCANTIIKTLLSVKDQTFKDWECLIINDGSTDDTKKIVEDFISSDNRFVLINKNHAGVSSARNAGLHKANGDWVLFVDSDDTIMSNCIYTLLDIAITQGAKIVQSSKAVYCDGVYSVNYQYNNQFVYVNKQPLVYTDNQTDLSLVIGNLYNKEMLIDGNIEFPSIDYAEDLLFNMVCISFAKKAFLASDILYKYNKSSSGLHNIKQVDHLKFVTCAESVFRAINTLDDSKDYIDYLWFKLINRNS